MEMFLSRPLRAAVAFLAVVACVSSAHAQERRGGERREIQRERFQDYGIRTNAEAEGELLDRIATPDAAGLNIEVESSWGALRLAVRLVGEFNVDNVLTVLAVLLAWNIPLEEAARALSASRAASGRMEMFGGSGRSPLAIVDYAHSPDALA